MIEIKEGQTTITKDEKVKIVQHCRFVIDTFGDKIREQRKDIEDLEQYISDAKGLLEKVNKLEVV